MSFEETMAAVVEAAVKRAVEPLRAELRRLAPPQLLTVEQAAERLGVSTATVRRRIKDGELPATKTGRQYRVDADALRPKVGLEVVDLAHAARTR